jgi:hypothetical protein
VINVRNWLATNVLPTERAVPVRRGGVRPRPWPYFNIVPPHTHTSFRVNGFPCTYFVRSDLSGSAVHVSSAFYSICGTRTESCSRCVTRFRTIRRRDGKKMRKRKGIVLRPERHTNASGRRPRGSGNAVALRIRCEFSPTRPNRRQPAKLNIIMTTALLYSVYVRRNGFRRPTKSVSKVW